MYREISVLIEIHIYIYIHMHTDMLTRYIKICTLYMKFIYAYINMRL